MITQNNTILNNQEYLLYDYSLENVGDSVMLYDHRIDNMSMWRVTNIEPITLNDGTVSRKIDFEVQYHQDGLPITETTTTDTWIEGIGSVNSVLYKSYMCWDMCRTYDTQNYCNNGVAWRGNNCTAVPTAICNSAPAVDLICGGSGYMMGTVTNNNQYVADNAIYGIQLSNVLPEQVVWLNEMGDTMTTHHQASNIYYLSEPPAGTYTLHLYDNCGNLAYINNYTTNDAILGYPYSIVDTDHCSPCSSTINFDQLPIATDVTWSTGVNGSSSTNLCSGQYTATINRYGCYRDYNFSIEDNTPVLQLQTDSIITLAAHCGQANGEIDISHAAIGGVPPYSYYIDGLSFIDDGHATNLSSGVYTGYIADNNWCNVPFEISIEATSPAVSATLTASECNDLIEVQINTGTAPYNYQWSHGFMDNVPNMPIQEAQTYTVTISDNNGCTTVDSIDITNAPITAFMNIQEGESCIPTLIVTYEIVGGTPPYAYQYDEQNQSAIVTDASGCSTAAVLNDYIFIPDPNCDDNDPNTVDILNPDNCLCEHIVVGINEILDTKIGVFVQPNPILYGQNINLFYILPPNAITANIKIYDLQGKIVVQQQTQHQQGSLLFNQLPIGMYLVNMLSDNGQLFATKLLVQ